MSIKKKWIIPAVVLLLALLLAGVYATRNEWTAYALRKVVNSHSSGQITLDLSKVEVDIFSGTLTIYKPELTFKDVYFNKKKRISLKKLVFQKLIFNDISPIAIIWYKQLICNNLIIEKPAFTLKYHHIPANSKAPSFDPTSLINVLQNHEITRLKFQFLIHHSEINFGEVRIDEKSGKSIYGSASYNMSIENLGTIKTTAGTLRPLSFSKFTVSVRNFHRHSGIDKMDIKLDSAFYTSRNNSLFLNGLQVLSFVNKKIKSPVAKLYLRWVKIAGLKTKKLKQAKEKTLQLNIIKIIGGSYTYKAKHKKQKKRAVSVLLRKFMATYKIFSLDSLIINHIHLFELNNKQDTLLHIRRMNLEMHKIWTTKRILTYPLKSLHYQTLFGSYQAMSFGIKKSPLFIQSGKGQYASQKKQLIIHHLAINTQCGTDTAQTISFRTRRFSLDSISEKKFQKGEHQQLGISLASPEFYWKADSICHQKSFVLPPALKTLGIEKIDIKNGRFGYHANKNLNITVSGIDLFANGLLGTTLSGPDASIQYDSLFYKSDKFRFSKTNTGKLLKTGKMLWKNQHFNISRFHFVQIGTPKKDTLTIRSVTFTKPKLNPLIFGQTLIARGAYLYKAYFSQNFQDSVNPDGIHTTKHWNHFVKLPFKTNIAYVRLRKSRFSLTSRRPYRDFSVSSKVDMKLYGLKMGYDTAQLISQPKQWQASLQETNLKQNDFSAHIEKTDLNSHSRTLEIKHLILRKAKDSSLQYRIHIPDIRLSSLNYMTLLQSDSLIFGKAVLQEGKGNFRLLHFKKDSVNNKISNWTVIYDSIVLKHTELKLSIENNKNLKVISINNLNLFYHPNLLHRNILPAASMNLMKAWDFDIREVTYADSLRKFHFVADRIAVQSNKNNMNIGRISGTNFSPSLLHPKVKSIYTYFLIYDMSLNDITLSNIKEFHIKNWDIPGMWVNIIDNDTIKNKKPATFLSSNFFSDYTRFLGNIHVDSSSFKNLNFSYQYDNMNKLINIKGIHILTNNIQLGESPHGNTSDALFSNMLINLNDRAIISGDSLYTFRSKDIRINLANRKISLDSITVIPRFNRKNFFARVGYQTDRITLYGKSAVLDNFNPNDLLNNHFFHFGNLQINNLSLRLERDKHYPRRENIIKPMPIGMLSLVPYRFRIDSVQLNNSMISYFEYEVVSKNPGIFFIDNFNVLGENVTNDLTKIDSNLVLKFKGSGKLMKQANLNFTLVMPYFAPHRQWWFSADAGQIDLTQFNLLTENVLGLTVRSGIGSLEVPMITGNDSTASGNVNFLYKKLRLSLYNRYKSQKSKKFYSPFANFVMNGIIINTNNPPFLGHTKKGIVYYERKSNKSFINYLWKSNLSGILSTLGFNNKQQREGKREEKKKTKTENKAKPNLKKKN